MGKCLHYTTTEKTIKHQEHVFYTHGDTRERDRIAAEKIMAV